MSRRIEFDLPAFHKALTATVQARQTNWKSVSEETGVSQSTLSRMSKGQHPDAASLTALCAWSGLNPVEFSEQTRHEPATPALVSKLLHADPQLDEGAAEALQTILVTAYEKLKRQG